MVIPGFVLAGGASQRMGRDKALLRLDGEPLAARTARILAEAGCDPVLLVGRQPGLSALGWPVLSEPDGRHHPLRGVAAALSYTTAPRALFAPCDLPGLTAAAVQRLLAVGGPCRAEGQHLLCILSADMTASVQARWQARGSVWGLVADLPAVVLPDAALHNANTPEELDRFR